MSKRVIITDDLADKIIEVVERNCGTIHLRRDTMKVYLVHSKNHDGTCSEGEYRFFGDLGSGGKFYFDSLGFRVDCYEENKTPERRAMIDAANVELKSLFDSFG